MCFGDLTIGGKPRKTMLVKAMMAGYFSASCQHQFGNLGVRVGLHVNHNERFCFWFDIRKLCYFSSLYQWLRPRRRTFSPVFGLRYVFLVEMHHDIGCSIIMTNVLSFVGDRDIFLPTTLFSGLHRCTSPYHWLAGLGLYISEFGKSLTLPLWFTITSHPS